MPGIKNKKQQQHFLLAPPGEEVVDGCRRAVAGPGLLHGDRQRAALPRPGTIHLPLPSPPGNSLTSPRRLFPLPCSPRSLSLSHPVVNETAFTFMHTFTHRRRSQPRKATASSSGAVRLRRLGSSTPGHSRRSRGSN